MSNTSSLRALDATQMGTQTAAALLGDTATAKLVNMYPADKKSDVYATVASVMQVKLNALPNSSALKQLAVEHSTALFNRSVWKSPTMTILYGATPQTFADQLVEAVKAATGVKLNKSNALKLGHLTYEALKEVLPAAIKLMESLTGIVKAVVSVTNEPFQFTTATGSVFSAYKPKTKVVNRVGQSFGFHSQLEFTTDEVNPGATAKSAAAQYIQSFDAAISMAIQSKMSAMGIPVMCVFDSWSVPSDKTEVLVAVAREAYIEVLSGDPLQAFYDEALANYPWLAEQPELFLTKGDYNVAEQLPKCNMFIGL